MMSAVDRSWSGGPESRNPMHVDAAADRQIRARAVAALAEAQYRPARDDDRRIGRGRCAVDGEIKLPAGDRDGPLIVEPQLRTGQRDLERRGGRLVAHDRVGD